MKKNTQKSTTLLFIALAIGVVCYLTIKTNTVFNLITTEIPMLSWEITELCLSLMVMGVAITVVANEIIELIRRI